MERKTCSRITEESRLEKKAKKRRGLQEANKISHRFRCNYMQTSTQRKLGDIYSECKRMKLPQDTAAPLKTQKQYFLAIWNRILETNDFNICTLNTINKQARLYWDICAHGRRKFPMKNKWIHNFLFKSRCEGWEWKKPQRQKKGGSTGKSEDI